MVTKLRTASYAFPDDGDLVERPGPGKAPTAFRIWKQGENPCKDFTVFFTERSAELLMQEQEAQGRPYSFDYNHGSVLPVAGADAGKAAGRHRLEVRNGDLWAVDCEWTPQARAGIECQPPEWPYFSPTFTTNEANEAIRYINTALTPNPATLNIPALASVRAASQQHQSGVTVMDKAAIEAAMAVLSSADSSEEDKEKARASLLALAAEDEDRNTPPPSDDDEQEASDEEEEEVQEEAKAASLKLASQVVAMQRKLDDRDKKDIIATRDDLPEDVRVWLAAQDLKTVKSFCAKTKKVVERRQNLRSDLEVTRENEDSERIARGYGRGSKNAHVGLGKPLNGVRALSFRKGA